MEAAAVDPTQASTVPGFHVALPSMQVGEVADVRMAPAYAFGSEGAAPHIPGEATVDFRLTLNWCKKYAMGDLYGDEEKSWREQIAKDPELTQSRVQQLPQQPPSPPPTPSGGQDRKTKDGARATAGATGSTGGPARPKARFADSEARSREDPNQRVLGTER